MNTLNDAPTREQIIAFLDGSGTIDGVAYGERHPSYGGSFWWRKFLPLLANTPESSCSPSSNCAAQGAMQYYYKDNACKAKEPTDPDCICWHDQGAGPRQEPINGRVTWRFKPSDATAQPTSLRDIQFDGDDDPHATIVDLTDEQIATGGYDAITLLANRFWSIHPKEIQEMGISRAEFYEREIRALLANTAQGKP